jgi:hypothetical protein
LNRELQKVGISWEEAKGTALDRTKWKSFTKTLRSTKGEKLVEALRYELEGRGSDSRWGH